MFDSIHYDQRYVSLLEVYQSGSFTAAGNVLSLTPSAVAQQVHSIEREINALLFIKSEHKLIPTKECEVVIKYINKIQSMCRRMSDDIELSKKNLEHLAIGITPSAVSIALSGVIEKLSQRTPPLQITVTTGNAAQLCEQLENYTIDLAVIEGSCSTDSFSEVMLDTDYLCVVVPMDSVHACRYMFIAVVLGGVVTSMNTLLSHLVRAEGRSLQASIGIVLGGVLNIVLDPLFMFVILPKGNEVTGAAFATMISNLSALVYFVIIITKNRGQFVLSAKPEKSMFRNIIPSAVISIGIPACLMTLCENISYAILDNLMSLAGTAQQAGIGVAKKVNMLAHCIVRGMSQGVLPLIGYNFASGNKKRMRQTAYISAGISIIISSICMTACLVFARELIGVFIPEASESHEWGNSFLRILCVGAPFSACAYAVISFFQATGHGVKSLILALLRKGVLDIPLMFILNLVYPIYGIVWATPSADILCCICSVILFILFMKKHGNDVPDLSSQKQT